MYKKTLRPGIAMIELIFALLIMGLVLMSAPQLISTATKSSYVTIQQESISEAAAQANMIAGYHWDEADSNESYLDPILLVQAGNGDLNSSAFGRRKGTPIESSRTFIRDDGTVNIPATTVANLGPDGAEKNDIDDYDGISTNLNLIDNRAGNVETTTIDINSTVNYISDALTSAGGYNQSDITFAFGTGASPQSTNIKAVEVELTSRSNEDELDKKIILHAFSCNIGGYKLEPKDF